MSWRTVITIAHRLQTVKECDKIFVIWANTVLEEWTHEQLVKKWWSYAKMVNLQSWAIEE
jgi:ABC-type multidrug transport system fused ATPase/permease subunit